MTLTKEDIGAIKTVFRDEIKIAVREELQPFKEHFDKRLNELGQRVTEMDERLTTQIKEMDQRFTIQFKEIDRRFTMVGQRLNEVNLRLDRIDVRMNHFDFRLSHLELVVPYNATTSQPLSKAAD
ncbi:MAG: hypothetical protein WDO14_11435 [Bacteroidota bacterium]